MKKITLFFVFLLMSAAAFTAAADSYVRGDLTGDGNVNVSDVTTLIDCILKGNTLDGADCNQDGRVNISDVTSLIDFVLKGKWPEVPHDYVDLGLPSGTLWATCNVGASSPEEYGDYFAWGETEPKEVYIWSTYKLCNGTWNTLTKYCTNSDYGAVDYKIELDPEDDAAYVNWGPLWRIPTKQQQDELREKCTSQWTTRNGVNGRLVTGPNGATLFLPAAGIRSDTLSNEGLYGVYYSRTIYSISPHIAYSLASYSGSLYWNTRDRCFGYSIRAVRVSQY